MIYDLHNDMLTGLYGSEHSKYLKNVGDAKMILAVWTTKIEGIRRGYFRRLRDSVMPFGEYAFAVEDLHFLDGCPLSVLSEIPLKYVGLTWNFDNALAGGALGNGTLTAKGKQVLSEAKRLGIAVDTAHLNRKSFFRVIDSCKGRVLNSHCCFDAVHSHPRNITDEQIKLLIDRNAVIGMTLESSFLSGGAAGVSDAVRHIDHFVQKFGCDNLALGTDFNGGTPPKELDGYERLQVCLGRALSELGYTEKDIEKIFFKNAYDFFA